jgi:hypothetical protein
MRGEGDRMTDKSEIEMKKKWWMVVIRSVHGRA